MYINYSKPVPPPQLYAIYLVQNDGTILQRYPGKYLSRVDATTAISGLYELGTTTSNTTNFRVLVYDADWDAGRARK